MITTDPIAEATDMAMVEFIASATAEAASPALYGLPLHFFMDRFTTDHARKIITDAYAFHQDQGDTPGRAAGRAGARLLRATVVIATESLAIQVGRAVEAAYSGQRQN
ncbi:hypothetical protein [Streptomyces sp. NBC_01601]|uniref:hypothetical protein n=1 Tax=Streptomyces sp. NBC_01601 TaxID=2975892 RepID=UPI002E290D17|nr:hypothetical protein [Streptomyces sp. NBC_01601]